MTSEGAHQLGDVPADATQLEMQPQETLHSQQGPVQSYEQTGIVAFQDFEDLFTRYYKPLVGFILKLSSDTEGHGDRSFAEDIVAEAYTRAMEHQEQFKYGYSLKAWVYAIAKNSLIDYKRHTSRFPLQSIEQLKQDYGTKGDVADPAGDTMLDEVITRLDFAHSDLASALRTLEPTTRQLLTLRFVEGLKVREIAERMQLKEHTVKNMLHRTMGVLRRGIGQLPDDSPHASQKS
jgi:RNA polymerase sigma factor (sigma-70 family)